MAFGSGHISLAATLVQQVLMSLYSPRFAGPEPAAAVCTEKLKAEVADKERLRRLAVEATTRKVQLPKHPLHAEKAMCPLHASDVPSGCKVLEWYVLSCASASLRSLVACICMPGH